MHECFAHMYVSIPPVCLVPLAVRRGPQISKNWSYRWLWLSLWVLGIELWSSIRTTLVLNGLSISPAGVLSNLYLNAQWGRLLINSKRLSCPLTLSPKLPCGEDPLHILTYSKRTNTETMLMNSLIFIQCSLFCSDDFCLSFPTWMSIMETSLRCLTKWGWLNIWHLCWSYFKNCLGKEKEIESVVWHPL